MSQFATAPWASICECARACAFFDFTSRQELDEASYNESTLKSGVQVFLVFPGK